MDLTLRAISDPSRRDILALLAERPMTVSDILEHFTFTQPALSKHLRILRDAGLVSAEDDGRYRRYRINAGPLGDVAQWLLYYRKFWNSRLDVLDAVLNEEACGSSRTKRGRA